MKRGTPEFRKLQEKWYRKLKTKGFKDIEKLLPDGDTELVHFSSEIPSERLEEGQAYYDAVADFLRRYRFRTATDRKIWRLHCQGLTSPAIGRQVGRLEHSVRRTILQLREVMRNGKQAD